jgi:hypothetical protein
MLISELTPDGLRWSFGVCDLVGDGEVHSQAATQPVAAEGIGDVERVTIEALVAGGQTSQQEATSRAEATSQPRRPPPVDDMSVGQSAVVPKPAPPVTLGFTPRATRSRNVGRARSRGVYPR